MELVWNVMSYDTNILVSVNRGVITVWYMRLNCEVPRCNPVLQKSAT